MTYECDQCGACCRFPIIEITPVDLAREPKLQAVSRPFKHGFGPCLNTQEDRDEYERIGPLVPGFEEGALLATGSFDPCPMLAENRCTVHATRPACCVAFQAGSDQCQEARAYHKLAPLEPVKDAKGVRR